MFKTVIFAFFISVLFPAISFADDPVPTIPGWSILGATGDPSSGMTIDYGKNGSLKVNKSAAFIIMQIYTKATPYSTPQIAYYKVEIRRDACLNGIGKVNYFSLDGVLSTVGDYVQGGSSLAASVGDIICSAANKQWQ